MKGLFEQFGQKCPHLTTFMTLLCNLVALCPFWHISIAGAYLFGNWREDEIINYYLRNKASFWQLLQLCWKRWAPAIGTGSLRTGSRELASRTLRTDPNVPSPAVIAQRAKRKQTRLLPGLRLSEPAQTAGG